MEHLPPIARRWTPPSGRVVDVNATLSNTQAMVIEEDTLRVVSIGVQRTAWRDPKARLRRFSLLNTNDWCALLRVFRAAAS